MRFFLLMAAYGIVAVVLETTWLADWPTSMLHFDFILVAVAAISFYKEWRQAAPVIFFFGSIMDMASGGPIGLSIISYLTIYGCCRAAISKISFQGGIVVLFWVAVVSLMDKFICSLMLLASTGKTIFPAIIMKSAPAQALLDSALALFMIPFVRWYWDLSWERITRPKGLVFK